MHNLMTVGLPISHKENEKRRALTPDDICVLSHPNQIYVEKGYGEVCGYSDDDYTAQGVNVEDRNSVLRKDIICDPKIGDADYLDQINPKIIFGWLHAVQNRDITEKIIRTGSAAYAWEDMYEDGRHVFWRNNEIAGEAAVLNAFEIHGTMPYDARVAVLGRGNVARGAIRILNFMGADVMTYDRRTEDLFRKELGQYDVIVNAILWDTRRKDHIIYRNDLSRMRKGSMIVDISCDRAGGVETSIPTTIDNPTYMVDGVRHYVVDHTPSIFYKSSSIEISRPVVKFLDTLIEDKGESNEVLRNALVIKNGKVLDKKIIDFQGK